MKLTTLPALILLTLTMTVFNACSNTGISLTGEWKLVSYGDAANPTPAIAGVDTSINFNEGQFGGNVEVDMNPVVREKILSSVRAKELSKERFLVRNEDELRADLNAKGLSDEDFLFRYLMRREDIDRMRALNGTFKRYDGAALTLKDVLTHLSKAAKGNSVHISKPGFNITLR